MSSSRCHLKLTWKRAEELSFQWSVTRFTWKRGSSNTVANALPLSPDSNATSCPPGSRHWVGICVETRRGYFVPLMCPSHSRMRCKLSKKKRKNYKMCDERGAQSRSPHRVAAHHGEDFDGGGGLCTGLCLSSW